VPSLPLAAREAEEEADARRGGRDIDDRGRRLIVAIGLTVAIGLRIAIGLHIDARGGAIHPAVALVPIVPIAILAARRPGEESP
jgi:hypothetical protein